MHVASKNLLLRRGWSLFDRTVSETDSQAALPSK